MAKKTKPQELDLAKIHEIGEITPQIAYESYNEAYHRVYNKSGMDWIKWEKCGPNTMLIWENFSEILNAHSQIDGKAKPVVEE